jgi:hypothetical protein
MMREYRTLLPKNERPGRANAAEPYLVSNSIIASGGEITSQVILYSLLVE